MLLGAISLSTQAPEWLEGNQSFEHTERVHHGDAFVCINMGTATYYKILYNNNRVQRRHYGPLSEICLFRLAQIHIYMIDQKYRAGLLNKCCSKLQSCYSLLSK